MVRGPIVPAGMAVRALVTAPDVTARLASAEMHPGGTQLDAGGAHGAGRLELDLGQLRQVKAIDHVGVMVALRRRSGEIESGSIIRR